MSNELWDLTDKLDIVNDEKNQTEAWFFDYRRRKEEEILELRAEYESKLREKHEDPNVLDEF